MRVLWILGELPIPADSGAKLRIMGLLKELAGRHAITAVALDPGTERARDVEELESVCESVVLLPSQRRPSGAKLLFGAVANLFSRLPYSVAKYCTRDTEYALAQVAAAPFDLIQCENIGFHRYLLAPASGPRILATHNVEADVWRQRARLCRNPLLSAYLSRQATKMARYEAGLAKSYDWVTAVTESDAARLRTDYGIPNVTVVPNGVDTDYFTPTGEAAEPGLVVFTGAMDYAPNDDAARYFLKTIWPLIRQRVPAAHFSVVGRRPSPSLRALAKRADHVEVTGAVPDVRPYLARASVVVVPLRMGGGSRLKILEAMAMGRPVVATTMGAEGIDLEPSRHILVADDPTALTEKTAFLLKNQGFGASLGQEGRTAVASRYSWAECSALLGRTWRHAREAAPATPSPGRRSPRQTRRLPDCRAQ